MRGGVVPDAFTGFSQCLGQKTSRRSLAVGTDDVDRLRCRKVLFYAAVYAWKTLIVDLIVKERFRIEKIQKIT